MSPSYSDIFADLNANQYKAVTAPNTNVMQILAGPGTGKTKVITSKVAYLLLHYKLAPEHVIVTTFTKKAANEMVERLNTILKPYPEIQLKNLFIGTFHSICVRLLRSYGKLIHLSSQFKIADEADATSIIKKTMIDRGLGEGEKATVKEAEIKKYRSFISMCKSQGNFPDEVPPDPKNYLFSKQMGVYEDYQKSLLRNNLIDFDDCLLLTCKLLRNFPGCVSHVKHVLVDEFQDTNAVQLELLYLFGGSGTQYKDNVTIVGDPDQSIYGFRNAESANFSKMAQYYKKKGFNPIEIVLDQNYRSTSNILDISEALMKKQHGKREAKSLNSNRPEKTPVSFSRFQTNQQEAKSISESIVSIVPENDSTYKYSDVAVLLRAGYLSRSIEQELIRSGLPYEVVHGRSFWELKEIKVMVDYLRVIASDLDWLGYSRTISFQIKGLGNKTLNAIENIYVNERDRGLDGNVTKILLDISSGKIKVKGLAGAVVSGLRVYLEIIEEARDILKNETLEIPTRLGLMFDLILKKTSMVSSVAEGKSKPKEEAKLDVVENLNELKNQLLTFNIREETLLNDAYNAEMDAVDETNYTTELMDPCTEHLSQFLDSIYLYEEARNQSSKDKKSKVIITTIHGAKGLEWPIVFVPALSEGIFPSQYVLKEQDPKKLEVALDEERRCLYVALTRAKEQLFLSSFSESFSYGNEMGSKPISRFITGLPKDLYVKRSNSTYDNGKVFDYRGGLNDRAKRSYQTLTMFDHMPLANRSSATNSTAQNLFSKASSFNRSQDSNMSASAYRKVSSKYAGSLVSSVKHERNVRVESFPPVVKASGLTHMAPGAPLVNIGATGQSKKKRLGMGRPLRPFSLKK